MKSQKIEKHTKETKSIDKTENIKSIQANDKMRYDLKKLNLNNIFKNTAQVDVEKYAFYLTNQNPVSSKLADEIKGVWIIEFANNIGIF